MSRMHNPASGKTFKGNSEHMRKIRGHGNKPNRPLFEIRPQADKIIAAMPDKASADFHDKFCELICGGANGTLALSPTEASLYLGKSRDYGRSYLSRLRKHMGPRGQ